MNQLVILGDVVWVAGPFQRIKSCRHDSAKIGFKIAMIVRALQPAMDAHRESHGLLLDKHGTPADDDPTRFHFRESGEKGAKLDEDRWQAYENEYNELLGSEVEVSFEKLAIDDLEHANIDPRLTPDEILSLAWLIELPDQETEAKKRLRKRKPKEK